MTVPPVGRPSLWTTILGAAWLIVALAQAPAAPPAEAPEDATPAPAAEATPLEQLLALDLPALEMQPWRFEGFPIVAWWPPPGTATPDDFRRYRDAGFTLYPVNPDTGGARAFAMAKAAGLSILEFRKKQGFGLRGAALDLPQDDDALVGWITRDEPGEPDAVIASVEAAHDLMARDPTRRAFFNLLPPHAQPAPGTEEVVRAAVRNGLPILSYDNYVMMADGSTRTGQHFRNLELFRRLSLENGVPFWAFALSIKHFGYRRPSESDVRWKQFTNLAYGAKGLWYFTYWGPMDWERWDNKAIVDPSDGSPTDLYDVVSAINHAVLDVAPTLLDLTSTAVVHLKPKEGCTAFVPNEHWIADVEARSVVIGFFRDSAGADYALVVNDRHGADKSAAATSQDVTLTFGVDVAGATALSWLDDTPGPLKLDEAHRATLRIAGGTGVLLKRE